MLEGKGEVLEAARAVSDALRSAGIEGGVVGGVAVFLHGYERTTTDVDVFTTDSAGLRRALEDAGFVWSEEKREFYGPDGIVPVQVLTEEVVIPPRGYSDIDGVRVIRLADLISMKMDSGSQHVHRMKDLADVVELILRIPLGGDMIGKIHPKVRREYRELYNKLGRR